MLFKVHEVLLPPVTENITVLLANILTFYSSYFLKPLKSSLFLELPGVKMLF